MSTETTKTIRTDGGGSTVRSTTYESRTSSSYESGAGGVKHRSIVTPRAATIIQRTSATNNFGGKGMGGGGGSMSMSRAMSQMSMPSMSSGGFAQLTSSGVQSVKGSRDREKKDMQDLNERFASYIEKVRFLEAQNRKLADELEKLKSKWGKETTAIKAMYQAELDEARRLLDEAEKEKAKLEIRCSSLEEQLEESTVQLEDLKHARIQDRETIERQNQQLSEYEAEINVLRRRIEQLENDREKDKKEIARLSDALNRARVDLDNETLAHIDAENRRQTLEEELEFLKQVHEQEMKELAALAYRDTTAENRDFWKNEMGNALREIQSTYDEKMDAMRSEMETYYNMKVQEFRTGATRQNMETVHSKEESKRLRTQLADMRNKLGEVEARNSQLERELELLRRDYDEKEREWETEKGEMTSEIAKLRAEMEAILKELQDIMDTKLGLELEIAAYRKLLEGEENRVGLKQVVENMLMRQDNISTATQQSMEYYIQQSANANQTQSASSSGGLAISGGAGSGGGGMSMGGGSSMSSGSMSMGGGGMSMGGGSMGGGNMSMQSTEGFSETDSSLKVSQVVKGEMSAKTTYQRSAKGPVSIMECCSSGKYVCLENTSRKDESIDGWRINRLIDGVEKANVTLPSNLVAKGNVKIKIWAQGKKDSTAGPNDIEANIDTWGVGANITTKLINKSNEDRATHIQKTIYTS